MGQALTIVIAAVIFVYAFYVIRKNYRQVKNGKCPGGCGTCNEKCSYRENNDEDGKI